MSSISRIVKALSLLLLCVNFATFGLGAAQSPEPDPFSGLYPVKVPLESPEALATLTGLQLDIDRVFTADPDATFPTEADAFVPLIAHVYVNDAAMQRLTALGFEATPIPNEGLRAFQTYGPGSGVRLAWPTFAQFVARMQALVTAHPDIVQLHSIGRSVQNRDIWCLKITDNPTVAEAEPEVKYTSTLHGDETTGIEMTMRFAELLANGYGTDPTLTEMVDGLEIWLCPISNPDGYVNGSRYNANGEDLNRSFPDPIIDPIDDPAGHEPEVQAFMNWGYGRRFVMGVNYHGGAQVVNYPWDGTTNPSPDDAEYITFSTGYAERNPIIWNNPNPARIIQGAYWYIIYGGMQDWAYTWRGEHHVTIEISNTKSPLFETMDTYWNANREAMIWWFQRPLRNAVHGIVTDANTGAPLAAKVNTVPARIPVATDPTAGDYTRLLLPGSYTLAASAPCYEPQTASITVVDGTPTVQNFALQPSPQWVITGTITAADTGFPLPATVTLVGPGTTVNADPFTGAYTLASCGGDYVMRVAAPGYRSVERPISLTGNQQQSFALEPVPCTLLVDDDLTQNYQTYFQSTLDSLGEAYNVWTVNTQGGPSAAALAQYGRVIWLTGKDSTTTLTSADQTALATYLDGGGRLFITGQDIGYDIGTTSFYQNYLHATYDSDDTNDTALVGLGYLTGLNPSISGGDGANNQDWPSDISPRAGAVAVMDYSNAAHLYAGVAYTSTTYRTVYFAFGFEAINTAAMRSEVMSRTLSYLGGCRGPLPADLSSSTATVSAETALPGDTLTYQLTLRNTGAPAMANLTATLPSQVVWTNALTATYGTPQFTGEAVTWAGFVPTGAGTLVSYTIAAAPCLVAGTPLVTPVVFDAGGDVTLSRPVTVTVVNAAPTAPHTPFPADGANEVETEVTLSWEAGTDLNCDTLHYSVALGASGQPLEILGAGLLTPTWTLDDLEPETDYQWIITATDGISSTAGPLWAFTTKAAEPADLSTSTAAVSAPTALPGESLAYHLTLRNTGAAATAGLTATLPSQVVWTDALTATYGAPQFNGSLVTWRDLVPGGTSVTVSYTVAVSPCMAAGTPLVTPVSFNADTGIKVQQSITVTVANAAPSIPHTPFPADGADEVGMEITLSWEAGEDLNCDAQRYTVAFGAIGQPLDVVATDRLTPTWTLATLEPGIEYRWIITATDGISSTAGPVWAFTTKAPPRWTVFLPVVIRGQ